MRSRPSRTAPWWCARDAGANFSNLARRLAREGLSGLEWAATVPGTIGGAVVNNAGAFGGCVADNLLDAVLVMPDGSERTVSHADLAYAYRTSRLKRGEFGPTIVRSARFRVTRDDPKLALARIHEQQARRTASQPRQLSAGSIFANPPGDYSGRLVEAVGLKGARSGGAEISAQHANFIVNSGAATAQDVMRPDASSPGRRLGAVWHLAAPRSPADRPLGSERGSCPGRAPGRGHAMSASPYWGNGTWCAACTDRTPAS